MPPANSYFRPWSSLPGWLFLLNGGLALGAFALLPVGSGHPEPAPQEEAAPPDTDAQNSEAKPQARRARAAQIARGEYLARHVAMCVECHTPRDATGVKNLDRLFQGGVIPLRSPYPNDVWAFKAPRIAGLPGRSEADVALLLQTGKDSRGWSPRHPMPGFRLEREDAAAIAAYLNSLE